MGVSFLGNTKWEPLTYPLWSVDGFGSDTATVRWSGSRLLKESWENGLTKFGTLPSGVTAANGILWNPYNSMWLENWTDSGGTPNIYQVDLHFRGFRTGVIPQPKSVDSLSLQSAQGQGTDNVSGETVTGTVYYYASRTTWTWFETATPPPTPRYATVNAAQNPFSNIVGYSMQVQESNFAFPINTINLSEFTSILNSLRPTYAVSEYEREEIIPARLYACTATIDYKLM